MNYPEKLATAFGTLAFVSALADNIAGFACFGILAFVCLHAGERWKDEEGK